jgi:hypothetical protein
MNDKIEQLAEQADIEWLLEHHPKLEKFAELIVRECAKRVDYWESRQGEHSEDLLKHFGVN